MRFFLHIIPYAALGGTEKDCLFFIRALPGDKHLVWVLGGDGPMKIQWQENGAEVAVLNIMKENFFVFYLKLKKQYIPVDPSGILYWSTSRLPLVRAALARFRCRMAVHAGNPANEKFFTVLKNILLDGILPGNISTRIFACSEYVRKTLLTDPYYRKFETAVSLNPVEIPLANNYTNKPINKSTIIRLGMVARLDPVKDHQTVIRAFAKVKEEYPNARLELVGDGPLREELKSLAQELAIQDAVFFSGSQRDVYRYLKDWDLFLYATTKKEGLGNAVTEALANGIPCVVTDLPMMREIDAGNNILQFAVPKDIWLMAKIAKSLLLDQRRRKDLSHRGFVHAGKMFSKVRYAQTRLDYLLG